MNKIIVKCPAKINLFLNIVGKDNNGYHLVHLLNQSVSLYDMLTIKQIDKGIVLKSKDDIPFDNTNSIYKAIVLFLKEINKEYGIEVTVEKNIPLMSGLGGESTDAAGTLIGLNELFNTNISKDKLKEIGFKIGCDVPFCIECSSSKVSGIGEIIEPWDNPYSKYLIVSPNIKSSTKEMFNKYDDLNKEYIIKKEEIGYNDFESVIEKEIKDIIKDLKKLTKEKVFLTGSGSSIIVLNPNEEIIKCCDDKNYLINIVNNVNSFVIEKGE